MSETSRKPSARTEVTRAKLIATAERLFAEKGIASVSLNEITRAAQQKNRNAVHYHFGSKQALIAAIFEKHRAPIARARSALIADIEKLEKPELEKVVAALVHPVADRFEDPDGGLAYIRISAQLAASNVLQFYQREAMEPGQSAWSKQMNHLWAPFLAALPRGVQEQRLSLIISLLFHGLADHAMYRESGRPELANTQLMLCNLIDSICAIVRAPVSDATQSALDAEAPNTAASHP
jgi:AcrR family transcriptional regulator